ncbi:MAG: response regulator [Deltaproteobacteria bacterium]|nr:response regulator [Deltaproteobacteria bacterium]
MAKILIVDDDQDFVEAISIVLKSNGYEVASANSRAAGMEAVKKESPDLIVLDVMLEQPDDGFTMAQDLRRQGTGTPILMLTSVGKISGMVYDKDPEMVPVDAFEEKPIQPDKLLAKVKELLSE